jgi:hypothetical protein
MLNGATCAPVSDVGAVLGGWGPELHAIVAPILPCLGPVGGLGVDHDRVATAEKECRRVEAREGSPRNYQPGSAADDVVDPVHHDEANRERKLDMQNPTSSYDTVEPDDLYAEQPIATEPVHRYSTRSGEANIY